MVTIQSSQILINIKGVGATLLMLFVTRLVTIQSSQILNNIKGIGATRGTETTEVVWQWGKEGERRE